MCDRSYLSQYCKTAVLDCLHSDQMTMECFAGRAEVWSKRGSQLPWLKAVVAYVCRTGVWLQLYDDLLLNISQWNPETRAWWFTCVAPSNVAQARSFDNGVMCCVC